ncbi:hypothetical protein [Helicobacter pametensis]|uniref:hypothetical protein n=1 Tax=Helicobacter pametensis TaxID=95149 RepID=UPI0004AFBDB7|nr:hypothetical protein [Helicobacter pametensis]
MTLREQIKLGESKILELKRELPKYIAYLAWEVCSLYAQMREIQRHNDEYFYRQERI